MSETFTVSDMSCDHCKSTVEGAVGGMQGVRRAEVDLDNKTVAVDFDDQTVGRTDIVRTIEEAGYSVSA